MVKVIANKIEKLVLDLGLCRLSCGLGTYTPPNLDELKLHLHYYPDYAEFLYNNLLWLDNLLSN